MADEENGTPKSVLERHLQTILSSIIAIGIVWLIATTVDLGKEQIRTTEQISQMRYLYTSMQEQVTRLAAERYTAAEAAKDRAATEARLRRLEEITERRRDGR